MSYSSSIKKFAKRIELRHSKTVLVQFCRKVEQKRWHGFSYNFVKGFRHILFMSSADAGVPAESPSPSDASQAPPSAKAPTLAKLVQQGTITFDNALEYAVDPVEFKRLAQG